MCFLFCKNKQNPTKQNLQDDVIDVVIDFLSHDKIFLFFFQQNKNVTHEKNFVFRNQKKMAGASENTSEKTPAPEELEGWQNWKHMHVWCSFPDRLSGLRQQRRLTEGPSIIRPSDTWWADQADKAQTELHRTVEQDLCRERGVDHVPNEEVEKEVKRRTREVLNGLK